MTIEELKAEEKIILLQINENIRRQREIRVSEFVKRTGVNINDKIIVDSPQRQYKGIVHRFAFHQNHQIMAVSFWVTDDNFNPTGMSIDVHPNDFKDINDNGIRAYKYE